MFFTLLEKVLLPAKCVGRHTQSRYNGFFSLSACKSLPQLLIV